MSNNSLFPLHITNQLADFLNIDHNKAISKYTVYKKIFKYIKENKLSHYKDKKIIYPDEKLSKILKIGIKDKIYYYNLYNYLEHHFKKHNKKEEESDDEESDDDEEESADDEDDSDDEEESDIDASDIEEDTKPVLGFTSIPRPISNELEEFLNLEHGTKLTYIDAMREIGNYIKSNNLKNSNNPRIIEPDEKLFKLLNPTEQLTWFNLMKYLRVHIIKEKTI